MPFVFQVLWVFIALGSVLFLVAITTKYIGTRTKKAMQGRYINVIETVNVGLDKQICLLKAGDDFVLIALSGKTITHLTTVSISDFEEDNESLQNDSTFDFKSFFENYLNNFNAAKKEKKPSNKRIEEISETSGKELFRENLNRLKRVTSRNKRTGTENGVEDTDEK